MERELQITFVAAGFGVLGTLLGSMLQYFTSERSARLRRLEEHKTRLRDEKREGYARYLAAVSDLFSELQYVDTKTGDYGDEASLDELEDDVFQELRSRLIQASNQVTRSYLEVRLIASRGEVEDAIDRVQEHSDKIHQLWNSGGTFKAYGDWVTQLGAEHGDLVFTLRKDLSFE